MKMMILTAVILVGLAVSGMAADAGKVKKGAVKHLVAFKFKESASKEEIEKVEVEFKALKKKISVIRSLSWGHNSSPENLNKGFTHGWVLSFDTEADRDTYLKHPDHEKFGSIVKPVLADVFVLDFVSGK